jgi:hypothetical protein
MDVQVRLGQQLLELVVLRRASGTSIPSYLARHFVEGRVAEAALAAQILNCLASPRYVVDTPSGSW